MLTPQVEFSHLFGIDALSMYNSYCNFVFLCFIYLLCPDRREGGNKRWFCLSVRPSICLSVCSSVAYIANNSRTQRPSMPKFGIKVSHLVRLAYQFQGQTVRGQGYRRAGAYRVGRTRRPHCLFLLLHPATRRRLCDRSVILSVIL